MADLNNLKPVSFAKVTPETDDATVYTGNYVVTLTWQSPLDGTKRPNVIDMDIIALILDKDGLITSLDDIVFYNNPTRKIYSSTTRPPTGSEKAPQTTVTGTTTVAIKATSGTDDRGTDTTSTVVHKEECTITTEQLSKMPSNPKKIMLWAYIQNFLDNPVKNGFNSLDNCSVTIKNGSATINTTNIKKYATDNAIQGNLFQIGYIYKNVTGWSFKPDQYMSAANLKQMVSYYLSLELKGMLASC